MAQLGNNGVKIKNHATDKMECFPKDRELLKGKAILTTIKYWERIKAKKPASKIVNSGSKERYQRSGSQR